VRQALGTCLWVGPTTAHLAGTGTDLLRTRGQLLTDNALLRQQLHVLRRYVKHPAMSSTDRAPLVLLVGQVRAWREALLVVQPETLLRWHRAGFRAIWRRKSRPGPGRPPLAAETVALIRRITVFVKRKVDRVIVLPHQRILLVARYCLMDDRTIRHGRPGR